MNREKNIPKNEKEDKDPESLARFDSVDEFKDFLNQSRENIVLFEDQVKQRQKQKETNQENASMGEKQTKKFNDDIDVDIQKFQDKISDIQKGLDKYDDASTILRRIDIAQKQKETNEENASMGEKQTKKFNDDIDVVIAELNQALEEMVVKKEEEQGIKKSTESTESTDTTGVSREKEKSLEEELIEEIEEAIQSKDQEKIRDITRKIYKMEKGEDASLSDFGSLTEMKKYLQEKLEEFQNKLQKEERTEGISTAETKTPRRDETSSEEESVVAAQAQKEHEAAMADREMLYSTKIDLMDDVDDKGKEKLKEKVKFVNKENIKETCEKEIKNLVKLSYDKEDKVKNEEYKTKIDALSEQMGLPQEEIQKIIDTQKANLEELTYQHAKKEKSKKESKWKKLKRLLPKMAIYGGAMGLGILTGGTFAVAIGAGMGAFRITETIFKGKKNRKAQDAAIIESKKMLLGEIDETDMSEAEKKEKDALIQAFYDDIFIKLSIEKQNQIDKKGNEYSELGMEIKIFEDEEYDSKDPKSKEKLQELYSKRRVAHKEQIKKYLEAQGLVGEELDKRVKLSAQLVELEDNQNIMELDFAKRKAGKVSKIFDKLDKILSHPAFFGGSRRGGNQTKEKLITTSIFAVAGTLARACPVVRNILMAYAGMKLGSAAANLFVSRENKELLKQVSAESINLNSNPDDIDRAKAQLLDQEYKKANPVEHAKLQEKIFAIDRAKMEALLGKSEGDEDGGYIGETNRRLEETIKKKRVAKGAHKGMKIFLGAAGAATGWFIGEYMNKIKAEQQQAEQKESITDQERRDNLITKEEAHVNAELTARQEELAKLKAERLAKLNKPIIVEKGDTVWGKFEDQLEGRVDNWDELNRAQKDYMIDLYKDKVVANPDLIGIDGGNASSLKIGDELNFTKLFEDTDEMNQAIEKATRLSQEAMNNIAANRDLIDSVMSHKLEDVSGTDLIKVMNIMGGGEESGAGFVQEFQSRATEIIGESASPEQMQTILHNPEVFGDIMDKGLDEVGDQNLIEATRLLNGTEAIGQNFVKEVAKINSPLGKEVSSRIEDLQRKITNKFGDIYHSQMHEDVGLGVVDTDPLAIQTEQALNNSENLIKQGQKIQELIGKSDSPWHKFWGINGRIERSNRSFSEAVSNYRKFVKKYNSLLEDGQSYGNSWFDLTGDKGLLQNYFQGSYLKNNETKIEDNVKNLFDIIKKINEHFASTGTHHGSV